MNAYKIIIGVAAGVAAGAVLGILFAPAKGTDTRKKISKTGRDLKDTVTEKYHDIIETVSGPFMSSKAKSSDHSKPGAVRTEAA